MVGTEHVRWLRRLHCAIRNDTWSEGLTSLSILLLTYLACGVISWRDIRIGFVLVLSRFLSACLSWAVSSLAFGARTATSLSNSRLRLLEERSGQWDRVIVKCLIVLWEVAQVVATFGLGALFILLAPYLFQSQVLIKHWKLLHLQIFMQLSWLLLHDAWLGGRIHDVNDLWCLISVPCPYNCCMLFSHAFDCARGLLNGLRIVLDYDAPTASTHQLSMLV